MQKFLHSQRRNGTNIKKNLKEKPYLKRYNTEISFTFFLCRVGNSVRIFDTFWFGTNGWRDRR